MKIIANVVVGDPMVSPSSTAHIPGVREGNWPTLRRNRLRPADPAASEPSIQRLTTARFCIMKTMPRIAITRPLILSTCLRSSLLTRFSPKSRKSRRFWARYDPLLERPSDATVSNNSVG